jgi:CheY-like chemotaxis protein/putative methionine-R-sulfoxide reductase with GAF domain
MKQILRTVAKQLTEFLEIKHAAVFRFDPSRAELVLDTSFGFSEESADRLVGLPTDRGILGRLIRDRIPQVVNNIPQTEEQLSFLTRYDGLTSMMAVPLFSGDRFWGILTAFSREAFKFQPEDARAINLFAGQLAELSDIFARRLSSDTDELLVRLLGSIELMNFKFRNRAMIPVSEILTEQKRMRTRILNLLTDSEQAPAAEASRQEENKGEEIVLPSGDQLNVEEVITIKGEKNSNPGTKKVLVIDDQPIVTDLLVSVLERMGYQSQVASSGTIGLEIFNQNGFDLVITDLGMPDVSGWQVSKMVKTKKPHVPVVVITGWGVDPDPNKMKESGADLIIYKPFQIDELEKIIRDLLKK